MKNLIQILTALCLCIVVSKSAKAQVPYFNSLPTASAVIYLDFDGQTVSGTSWNSTGPIVCAPSGMTSAQITEMAQRIAEDYRPFNVTVTTDSTLYWAANQYKRMRAIFTTTSDWYGAAGGVAFIGSFSWGDNTPCFIFSALLQYNTKWVAEAGAHEVGHTLGLRHQSSWDNNCVKTAEYNAGVGSGEIGWAPVMGVGYYRNLTLWNNGTNPYGCTNYQDDLAIITSGANGFTYRTDDFAASINGQTTQVPFVNNALTVNGIIERYADQDVFKINVPSNGMLHLSAMPYSVGAGNDGADVDLQVQLLTNSNTVIGTYNPSTLLNATIDTFLNSGNYYVRVQPVGNTYANEYAVLGSYTVSASFLPGTALPLRRLELNGSTSGSQHKLNWLIDADEQVVKQEIEVSADGRNFETLTKPASGDRSFTYIPQRTSMLYYRTHVTFDNGQAYYSNTIALKGIGAGKPSLVNTVANSDLKLNSPAGWRFSLTDYSGRVLSAGNLTEGQNLVHTSTLPQGMYLIRFSNGQEQVVEKFMKQ